MQYPVIYASIFGTPLTVERNSQSIKKQVLLFFFCREAPVTVLPDSKPSSPKWPSKRNFGFTLLLWPQLCCWNNRSTHLVSTSYSYAYQVDTVNATVIPNIFRLENRHENPELTGEMYSKRGGMAHRDQICRKPADENWQKSTRLCINSIDNHNFGLNRLEPPTPAKMWTWREDQAMRSGEIWTNKAIL